RTWTYSPAGPAHPVDVEVLDSRTAPAGGVFSGPPHAQDEAEQAASASYGAPVEVPALVQLRRTYLVFERSEGVVLIDQHSAHERILFEQFMNVLERGAAPSQRLVFPATLPLG